MHSWRSGDHLWQITKRSPANYCGLSRRGTAVNPVHARTFLETTPPGARGTHGLQGDIPGSHFGQRIFVPLVSYKPRLITFRTFVLFHRIADAGRMQPASGQRESATNRLGEHGGNGLRPDAAAMQSSP